MKFISLLSFLCIINNCTAQQNYFLYLQTENQLPFYARLDKKIYASTNSGYVIIPKLTNGNYSITIGFPKTNWPEQNFNCSIGKTDVGFIVKKRNDSEWNLFNLQTMQMIASRSGQEEKREEPNNAIVENAPQPVSEVQTDTQQNTQITVASPADDQQQEETGESQKNISGSPNVVKKIQQKQDEENMEMTYVDVTNDQADTIQVAIPIAGQPAEQVQEEAPIQTNTDHAASATQEQPEEAISNMPKAQESEVNATPAMPPPEEKTTTNTTIITSTKTTNIYCDKIADDDDFFKLRKKMAAQSGSERMVAAAKKFFKNECFTTEQIKNLSVLFLTDEGKYKLFDAAYPYISDLQNFATLEQQLSDDYYINRFKAMIKN